MNLQIRRLLALLDYAQETMRTRSRGSADVHAHGSFLLFDHQVEELEGNGVSVGGNDADAESWLTVAHPPAPEVPPEPDNAWLVPWLSVGAALQSEPVLAKEIEGSTLIAAGTHRDSSQPAVDLSSAADPLVEASARIGLADYPFRAEVEKQYAAYLHSAWNP